MNTSEREHPVEPIDLPASLAELLSGRGWSRNTVGESGDAVYRLQKRGTADLYLKHAPSTRPATLRAKWCVCNGLPNIFLCRVSKPSS